MDWLGVTMIALIVVGVLSLIYYNHWAFKKRQEQVAALADSLGLEFQPASDHSQLALKEQIRYFDRGSDHRVYNHLSGRVEPTEIHIFDYSFVVGSGKNRKTRSQTVVLMLSSELVTPAFDLAPETIFSWVTDLFGVQDIDFDNHPEFSKKFVLQADNEADARRLFDQELLDYFCTISGYYVSVRPQFLCVYRPDQPLPPDQWKDLMTTGFNTYQQLLQRGTR